MKVLTLFVRHGTDKHPDAINVLKGLYSSQFPDIECKLLIIDNQLPPEDEHVIDSETVVIGGSNDSREFSAWQDGIKYVNRDLQNFDFVHLVTEAFNTLHTSYLNRIDQDGLAAIRHRAAALGHVDYYNSTVTIFGRRSQSWIRSSYVFLPVAEIMLLGPLVTVASESGIFTDDLTSPFALSAPLSDNYKEYLLNWLTGAGTGQGVQWHSRFELTTETFSMFRSKVLAILNEHMLAVRLRGQGCSVVDATWLASRPRSEPLQIIPSWQYQLTHRDTDTVQPGSLFR